MQWKCKGAFSEGLEQGWSRAADGAFLPLFTATVQMHSTGVRQLMTSAFSPRVGCKFVFIETNKCQMISF